MRYAADHKEKTRERILAAAATVFRRKGFSAGSVDDVMREAGLTAGGFYGHFSSKDELFLESLMQTMREARVLRGLDESADGTDRVRSISRKYLSGAHRRMIEQGCVMPPLLADLSRQDESARQVFQKMLVKVAATYGPHLGDSAPRDRAFAILAILIGGMTLARAVDDALSERILAACREFIDESLEKQPRTGKSSRRPAIHPQRSRRAVRKSLSRQTRSKRNQL